MKKLIFLLITLMFFAVSCGKSTIVVEHKEPEAAEDTGETQEDEGFEEEEEEESDEEEEEEESEEEYEDLPLEEAVCKPNPCKKLANSTGKCEFDGDNSYICHCEPYFFWEDYKCVGPCDDDPCGSIENSEGCYAKDRKTFVCRCKENYFWTGEACINPCDAEPCQAHAECYPYDSDRFGCYCKDNFFEKDGECVSPCDPNPCKDVSNSTGKCTAKNQTTYTCTCKSNYVFTSANECVSPCDPNPCAGIENSTGKCYTIDESSYSCGCDKNFYWSDETGGCLAISECSAENNGLCKDPVSKLIWSSRAGTDEYLYGLYLEEAKTYCADLKEGGFTDWHLPTIDELRTLVVNCPGLETSGKCKVSDKKNCLSANCYNESDCLCEGESETAVFSKFGYEYYALYWSSSSGYFEYSERNWLIELAGYANVVTFDPYDGRNDHYATVRCVRK